MVLKNKLLIAALLGLLLLPATGALELDSANDYTLFVNEQPFSLAISAEFDIAQGGNYRFTVPKPSYLKHTPAAAIKDMYASIANSRSLIVQEAKMADNIEWTLFDVPEQSELIVKYRLVAQDFYNPSVPLRTFYNGRFGLVFLEFSLLQPLPAAQGDVKLHVDSKGIKVFNPFNLEALDSKTFYTSSIQNLAHKIVPIGRWSVIRHEAENSFINVFIETKISNSVQNRLKHDFRRIFRSTSFRRTIAALTQENGIMSQFVIMYYEQEEPDFSDEPVLYYHDTCILVLPMIGDYVSDTKVLLYREVLRQCINLYKTPMDMPYVSEYLPVNGLLSALAVANLRKEKQLDTAYVRGHMERQILNRPVPLAPAEYAKLQVERPVRDVYRLPGLLHTKANMFYKVFFLLQHMLPEQDLLSFSETFLQAYQEGVARKQSLPLVLDGLLPKSGDMADNPGALLYQRATALHQDFELLESYFE